MNTRIFDPVLIGALIMLLAIAAAVSAKDKGSNPVGRETLTRQQDQQSRVPIEWARAGEEINWQVISSGGDIGGISTNYRLSGTDSRVQR